MGLSQAIDNLCIYVYNVSMKFNKACEVPFEVRVTAVETYIHSKQTLREIADSLGVSYPTLWHWVKKYEEKGREGLRKNVFSRRKFSKDIEAMVMHLKEKNPCLTVRRARQLLKDKSIDISNKSVWRIWKKYGFVSKRKEDPLGLYAALTPESERDIERARALVEKKDYNEAARILNNLPAIPECAFLKNIPEKYLTLRRRVERLQVSIGEIAFPLLLRKARQLCRSFEKKGHIYSSVAAHFIELTALGWLRKPMEEIKVHKIVSKKMHGIKDSALRFVLLEQRASTYGHLLQVGKALELIAKCRRLVYQLPFPLYWQVFGDLLTTVGKYRDAHKYYRKALQKETDERQLVRLALKIAIYGHAYAGDYTACLKMLTKAHVLQSTRRFSMLHSIGRAHVSFGKGNLIDASKFYLEPLKSKSKARPLNRIYGAAVGLASVAMALNKRAEAKSYLKKYLPLIKKHRLTREDVILECLINQEAISQDDLLRTPPLHLLNLLAVAHRVKKVGGYRKALDYAKRQELSGLLHRWIVFFPESVLHMYEKGKRTGLPRAILSFPIFNQKRLVYNIRFLGRIIVSRNNEYIKTRLSPKERAFLIHLSLRAGEPGRFVPVEDVCRNFWSTSKDPVGLLLHLLTRLKRKVRMPTHLLGVSSRYTEPRLINNGVYLTNDYNELENLSTLAKTLEQAGEWKYAMREYKEAFKLIRGESFRKMYDNWSEQMRRVISNQIENAARGFTKLCAKQGVKQDAMKILQRISRIIPISIL